MRLRFRFACILAFAMTPTGHAETIELVGVVRDFRADHPDYEAGVFAFEPGIVDPVLGPDGKPIYDGAGFVTTHGQGPFDQWYRDTIGVNLSAILTMTLDNGMAGHGGVYTFADTEFFPIDESLWGNEGLDHNYHFTVELHARFTYVPGFALSFSSDDDLWVFIDDGLVVDLGGVHDGLSQDVELDTLGLVPGASFDFALFYAQRHTGGSSLEFETVFFIPAPSTLAVLLAAALPRRRRRAEFSIA
jgi:fibro-slime domain-containing protein